MAPIFYAQFTHILQKTHKKPAHTRREANAETRTKPGFFEFQKRPEKGVKSATNQKVGGSSPSWRATSEQSPLCSDVFFCLRHKKPPGAPLPCSSSPQKVTLRLRCSLVNAITTLWLATNFLRKRARAQLFLSGLQFPYKIPAGEAQRDFPVLRGHPPRLFLPAFLPAGELRFCKAKWEFFKLPSNFSPELTER